MRTHVDTVTAITNVNYLYKHRTFILIIFVVSKSFTAIKKGADILQQYKKPRPKRTVSCIKHRVMHTTANKKAKFGVHGSCPLGSGWLVRTRYTPVICASPTISPLQALLVHPCTKCRMRYCEGVKMSLFHHLLARL